MNNKRLSNHEIGEALTKLLGWQLEGSFLIKTFLFPDFPAAMGFMAEVGVHAEALNHHPDWSNVYNRVHVKLSSHDLGGVSQACVELAQVCETVAPTYLKD
jgi:4a-hydroxytetrahydrobiopterin dehydratase